MKVSKNKLNEYIQSLFISMGRKQKYITDEEKLNARRERQMRYYFNNQQVKKEQALERYYKKKGEK